MTDTDGLTCPSAGGADAHPCDDCGTGYIWKRGRKFLVGIDECSMCHGFMNVSGHDRCPNCEGRGVVADIIKEET